MTYLCGAVGAVALNLFAVSSAVAQDRMPPIPPDKYDEAQKKEAEAFQVARKGPVFGPFSVLIRSPELMTAYRIQGDYLRLKPSIGTKLSERCQASGTLAGVVQSGRRRER